VKRADVSFSKEEAVVYFVTPTELKAKELGSANKFLRMGGMVVKGSLQKDTKNLTYRFELTDGATTFPVSFRGVPPDLFSANGQLMVTEETRQAAIALCHQSDQTAALGCMHAFATTDFRDDLKKITVPTLILHGDSDAIVPFEGSGQRTHKAIKGSEVVILEGAPHGCNTSHADRFNLALLNFLKR